MLYLLFWIENRCGALDQSDACPPEKPLLEETSAPGIDPHARRTWHVYNTNASPTSKAIGKAHAPSRRNPEPSPLENSIVGP